MRSRAAIHVPEIVGRIGNPSHAGTRINRPWDRSKTANHNRPLVLADSSVATFAALIPMKGNLFWHAP
jgi:hypothetical protein